MLRHHRRSIRLRNYDYRRAGAYFVTICTRGRECVLDDGVASEIILDVWESLPNRFPTIALDEFVVMPNHVHLVVWLQSNAQDVGASPLFGAAISTVGVTLAVAPVAADVAKDWHVPTPTTTNMRPALSEVIGAFKSTVFTVFLDWIDSHKIAKQAKFWQRNYYEHIVRNERELQAIRRYIRDNPANWQQDRDNPINHVRYRQAESVDEYLREAGL